jgi:hypothetical protein
MKVTHLNSNLISCPSEQLLPKSVALLPLPFFRQKCNDRVCPLQELVAVAPDRVRGVGFRYCYWVSMSSRVQCEIDQYQGGSTEAERRAQRDVHTEYSRGFERLRPSIEQVRQVGGLESRSEKYLVSCSFFCERRDNSGHVWTTTACVGIGLLSTGTTRVPLIPLRSLCPALVRSFDGVGSKREEMT